MRGRNGAELRRKERNAPRTARSQCAVLVILHICPTSGNYLYDPPFTAFFLSVTFIQYYYHF